MDLTQVKCTSRGRVNVTEIVYLALAACIPFPSFETAPPKSPSLVYYKNYLPITGPGIALLFLAATATLDKQ